MKVCDAGLHSLENPANIDGAQCVRCRQAEVVDQLRAAAGRRREAESQWAAIRSQTGVLLHQARRQGITVSRLEEATGLTRATIYKLLHREAGR